MQLQALALNEASGRNVAVARVLSRLGLIYHRRGDLDRAEDAQLKTLALYGALDDKQGMASAYRNLADIYHGKNDRRRMYEYKCKERDLWREMGLGQEVEKVEQWLRDNGYDG
jgi:tetratricopeptide (TPR) repeat protein